MKRVTACASSQYGGVPAPARGWLGVLGILLLVFVAYVPALSAGFIWDDDFYVVDNQSLRTTDGLRRVWTDVHDTPQYYPLVFTTFWLEYRAWQQWAPGYHVINVLLHAGVAILLWRVLIRLQVPLPWLAAAVFAVHPVHVESVAWITERKNVLSGVFCLAALLACLALRPPGSVERRSTGLYLLALALFFCALLSKTATAVLPPAILILIWWKQGCLRWKDVLPLLPMFLVGILMGLLTAWLEKHHVGAAGDEFGLSPGARLIVAARALWFYAGKLVWPHPLVFIYPRWTVDSLNVWQYLYVAAALALVVTLWALRGKVGRGPLAAVLLFGGILFPALGFIDVYPMRYSYVADHFQYLGSIPLLMLMLMGLHWLTRKLAGNRGRTTYCSAVSLVIAILLCKTFVQAGVYRDAETLWRHTLRHNPAAWMAHNNLGTLLESRGETLEAERHYRAAIGLKPDYIEARHNLAGALARRGQSRESLGELAEVLRRQPTRAQAWNDQGMLQAINGDLQSAEVSFREALRLEPDYALAVANLGTLLLDSGRPAEGVGLMRRAVELAPENADLVLAACAALHEYGRAEEAVECYRTAVRRNPGHPRLRARLEELMNDAKK